MLLTFLLQNSLLKLSFSLMDMVTVLISTQQLGVLGNIKIKNKNQVCQSHSSSPPQFPLLSDCYSVAYSTLASHRPPPAIRPCGVSNGCRSGVVARYRASVLGQSEKVQERVDVRRENYSEIVQERASQNSHREPLKRGR